MDPRDQQYIKAVCRDLVISLSHHLDRSENADGFALFTDDGVLVRGGVTTQGRDRLIATSRTRPASTLIRHLATNIRIQVDSPTQASGTTTYLCYVTTGVAMPQTAPARLGSPYCLGEWHDQFILTEEGWRFLRRETHRLLETTSLAEGAVS